MIARHLSGHRLAILFAVLALAVRMIVPAGFMPMAGSAALILCPAQGAMPAAAMHGMHHGKATHDDGKGQPTCPFAAAGAAIDLTAPPPVLALPPMPLVVALLIPLAVTPGLGLAAPPPPKTGPPPLR